MSLPLADARHEPDRQGVGQRFGAQRIEPAFGRLDLDLFPSTAGQRGSVA